jgi:hypothetical protein
VTPLIAPLCLYAAVNFAYALVGSFAEAFGYLRRIWLVQLSWTSVLLLSLWLAVRADADMRTLVLVAVGVQIAVHALQVGVLAQLGTIGLRGTIAAEAWAMAVATVWYIATAMVTNGLSEATVATRVAGSLGIGAALAAGTWFLLPHLPAGRALVRRGIRIPLTRDPARTS